MEGTLWSDGLDDELVRELLDDVSPFFLLPQERNESKPSPSSASSINQLVSKAYSGPRIEDIENALSVTQYEHHFKAISEARVSILDKGLNKGDNKYTLRIKCCDNSMADDGYKWRKYGQKSIKNSPYPRSYYRCTNPRCGAKKQVERSIFDPETLIITYEGLHLHYAYPYFLSEPEQANPPAKKLRNTIASQAQAHQTQAAQGSPESFSPDPLPGTFVGHQTGLAQEEMGPRGLLEDVVPFMIRNPSNTILSSNSSSSSSQPSPPTSPSLSWSPTYSPLCFHTGV